MSDERRDEPVETGAEQASDEVSRVRLRGIRKSYGTTEALRGVDLDLAPGEILGLVGDNAAGKSTLSKVLSGAVVPDDGEIHVDGEFLRTRTRPNTAPAIHSVGQYPSRQDPICGS